MRTCGFKDEESNERCGEPCKRNQSYCPMHKLAHSRALKVRRAKGETIHSRMFGVPKEVFDRAMRRIVPRDCAEELLAIESSPLTDDWTTQQLYTLGQCIVRLTSSQDIPIVISKLKQLSRAALTCNKTIDLTIERLGEL